MQRKLLLFSLALLLCVCGLPLKASFAASTPTFSLLITDATPTLNQTFQVNVNGANLTDLYAHEVNITYDASRLQFVSAVNGYSGFTLEPILKGNTLQLAHTQIGTTSGHNGQVTMATLTFKAISLGSAEISLTSLNLVNSQLNAILVPGGANVIAAVGSGAPTPTTAPTATPSMKPTATPQPKTKQIVVKPKATIDPTTHIVTTTVDPADWAKADLEAKSDATGKTRIRVEVEVVAGAKEYVQLLPSSAISGQTGPIQIEIVTPLASVIVPSPMFPANQLPAEEVGLHIAQVNTNTWDDPIKTRIGAHPVIELTVQAGGKIVPWHNPKSPVVVSVPYTPTAIELENPEHIVIWSLEDDGNMTPVPNGKYNLHTGQVTFVTTHLTKYAISFVENTFADIDSLDWAKKQIEVLASKGIIQGTTDDTFSPWQAVTRADFVVLLVRTLELQGILGTPFTDVPEDSYYNDSLRIAREVGIATGSGDNRFEPQAPITREDMMVLIDRALKTANKQRSTGPLGDFISGFTDRADISGYAMDSIAALIQLGLVHGFDQAIHPKETSNRAQTSVLMYNLYNYLHEI